MHWILQLSQCYLKLYITSQTYGIYFVFKHKVLIHIKKLMWPTLSIELRMPSFQQCMFGPCTCGNCWRIRSLGYAWSGFPTQCCPLHPMLHVLLNTVMTDAESTFHFTQYMSLADNTRNLTLPHAYASSLSYMVLPWLHKLYWQSSHFRILVTFLWTFEILNQPCNNVYFPSRVSDCEIKPVLMPL